MNLNLRLFEFCNALAVPFNVERWRSTSAHNRVIGGAPNSKHLTGDAIDLSFDSKDDLLSSALLACMLKFEGIELDLTNNHLHVDCGPRLWHVTKTYAGYVPLDEAQLAPSSSPA